MWMRKLLSVWMETNFVHADKKICCQCVRASHWCSNPTAFFIAIVATDWAAPVFVSCTQMENISNFLKACRAVGVAEHSLFETVDLYESKDLGLVVRCLVRVAVNEDRLTNSSVVEACMQRCCVGAAAAVAAQICSAPDHAV